MDCFDLDSFSVCLAANLLGAEKVEQQLKDVLAAGTNRSFRQYWRGPLLIPMDEAMQLPAAYYSSSSPLLAPSSECDESNVVFLDLTWEFRATARSTWSSSPLNQKAGVSLVLGTLLCSPRRAKSDEAPDDHDQQNHMYCYVQGQPVSTSYLENHMDQVDLCVRATASHVISKFMAKALMAAKQGLMAGTNGRHDGCGDSPAKGAFKSVAIPLEYDDGSANLTLQPSRNSPSSEMNDSVASMLFANIMSCPHPFVTQIHSMTTLERDSLLHAFRDWQTAAMGGEGVSTSSLAAANNNVETHPSPGLDGSTSTNICKITNPYRKNPLAEKPSATSTVESANPRRSPLQAGQQDDNNAKGGNNKKRKAGGQKSSSQSTKYFGYARVGANAKSDRRGRNTTFGSSSKPK